jgi:Helix-turn-helix family
MGGRGLSEANARSRAVAVALEPVAGSVYFAPEAHEAYAALGFGPSPGPVTGNEWAESHWGRVHLPDGVAYFASRGGVLGQVRGEVVAAAFGVFNPAVVVAAVDAAWSIATADDVVAARTRGAVAQLVRILGPEPDGIGRVVELLERAVAPLSVLGRPMFAGLSALPMPTDPMGRMWRLGDLLREYRGDAHVAAAAAAGLDGCDLQVLTERCAGMPPRTYAAGRGWDPTQLAGAEDRLTARGLLVDGQPTSAGLVAREALEAETDRLCVAMIDAIGDGVVELVGRLQSWGAAIRAADGYYASSPQEAVLAAGVQD